MRRRGSGILLHITSLPSGFGVGDIGPWARRFIDFLSAAGQSAWQILPIGPTSTFIGSSPYSSFSAFAGNPLLISPEGMAEDGLLHPGDVERLRMADGTLADYPAAEQLKSGLMRQAFASVRPHLEQDPGFIAFRRQERRWLPDYALFAALKNHHGGAVWNTWPARYRDRDPAALCEFASANVEAVLLEEFTQYVFFSQWRRLKAYAASRGVVLVGDVPIYVLLDSADVWANPRYFCLDECKRPVYVAGVPPDYFSATGQLWGNPVYDWEALRKDKFGWWVDRVGHNVGLYDLVRIDHFRGFAGYWRIPAAEKTAICGEWVDAPGMELFETLAARFAHLPVVAEDLGVITPDVRELRDAWNLPGMRILQFAFGENIAVTPDAPHNHIANCIAYTGTHDNNTSRGWFAEEASHENKQRLSAYVGHELSENTISRVMMRLLMSSVARLAIFPYQDALGLGSEARMNRPSIAGGNWRWRTLPEQFSPLLAQELRELAALYGRC